MLIKSSLLALTSLFAVASFASAETLLLNFHSTNANDPGVVAGSYLTLSPAHSLGAVSSSDTTWNNFNSTATSSSLLNANGTSASGVSIVFGQESSAGSGSINYNLTSGINLTALYGSGGAFVGQQSLVGDPLSIYGNGNNTTNSAPGRAGWLGSTGNATTGNTAIGLRIDGLQAGTYTIYVMGRNTNGNQNATPMNFFAAAGPSAAAFDFSLLTPTLSANPVYPNTNTTAYNTFINGENYATLQVTITAGQSLFLASDGASASETRGFLNMVEIAPVPEVSTLSLLFVGLGLTGVALRIRRRDISAH